MPKLILNEEEVKSLIIESLGGRLADTMNGYNRRITEIMDDVINVHEDVIRDRLNEMLSGALKSKAFGKTLAEEFNRKVAKNLVAKLEGSVERSVDAYRSNPLLKAKIITAIESIVNDELEHLKEIKND